MEEDNIFQNARRPFTLSNGPHWEVPPNRSYARPSLNSQHGNPEYQNSFMTSSGPPISITEGLHQVRQRTMLLPQTQTFSQFPSNNNPREFNQMMANGLLQQQMDRNSTPSSKNEDVMTGVVTQFQGNCGMISNQVFFHLSSVAGGRIPKVGDKVVVDAERVAGMPFKFNAKKVQCISKDLSRDSLDQSESNHFQMSEKGPREDLYDFGPLPEMPSSLNLNRDSSYSNISSASQGSKSPLFRRRPPPPPPNHIMAPPSGIPQVSSRRSGHQVHHQQHEYRTEMDFLEAYDERRDRPHSPISFGQSRFQINSTSSPFSIQNEQRRISQRPFEISGRMDTREEVRIRTQQEFPHRDGISSDWNFRRDSEEFRRSREEAAVKDAAKEIRNHIRRAQEELGHLVSRNGESQFRTHKRDTEEESRQFKRSRLENNAGRSYRGEREEISHLPLGRRHPRLLADNPLVRSNPFIRPQPEQSERVLRNPSGPPLSTGKYTSGVSKKLQSPQKLPPQQRNCEPVESQGKMDPELQPPTPQQHIETEGGPTADQPNDLQNPKAPKPDFVCHNCLKPGHPAAICTEPKNKEAHKVYMNMNPEFKQRQNHRRQVNKRRNKQLRRSVAAAAAASSNNNASAQEGEAQKKVLAGETTGAEAKEQPDDLPQKTKPKAACMKCRSTDHVAVFCDAPQSMKAAVKYQFYKDNPEAFAREKARLREKARKKRLGIYVPIPTDSRRRGGGNPSSK